MVVSGRVGRRGRVVWCVVLCGKLWWVYVARLWLTDLTLGAVSRPRHHNGCCRGGWLLGDSVIVTKQVGS